MRREIDILKALAIFAVFFLHFGAFKFTPQTLWWDQILRFCVPLFVALSGFTLAKKYLAVPFSLKDFYLRRTIKLLPSYIFWSLIITLTLNLSFDPINFLKMLIWGGADYHLYFVPMIFQLYLLFPLIFFAIKKFSWKALLICLTLQIASYYYYSLNPQFNDQSQYIHFITWIYFFALGIYLAQSEDTLNKSRVTLIISLLLIISGYIWCLLDATNLISKHADLIVVTKTAKYSVVLYATGIISLGVLFGKKILVLPEKIVNFLAFLGVQSYVIYLCHTLFLRLIFSVTAPEINQGNPLIIFSGLLIGLILTYFPVIASKAFTLRHEVKQSS